MDNISTPKSSTYHQKIKQMTEFLESEKPADTDKLAALQEQLDELAKNYQNNESIGTDRYLLYHAQAFIHYRSGNYDDAKSFMESAITIRGESYELADDFIKQVNNRQQGIIDPKSMTKSERRKHLIGLEGWLAFFIVGLFLSLLVTMFTFFADGFLTSADIAALNETQAGLGDTLQTVTALEIVALIIYISLIITTLVLLFRKRKLAKTFAIGTLIFAAVYGVIDYLVVSNIFESSPLADMEELQAFMSTYMRDVSKSVVSAFIWVPYFLVSKRVAATLNKE